MASQRRHSEAPLPPGRRHLDLYVAPAARGHGTGRRLLTALLAVRWPGPARAWSAWVRHAQPAIDPALPAALWPLSDEGVAQAVAGAAHPALASATVVFASVEPKAQQTAAPLAARLGRPLRTAPGLGEQRRPVLPWHGAAARQRLIAAMLAQPRASIAGCEPIARAQRRIVAWNAGGYSGTSAKGSEARHPPATSTSRRKALPQNDYPAARTRDPPADPIHRRRRAVRRRFCPPTAAHCPLAPGPAGSGAPRPPSRPSGELPGVGGKTRRGRALRRDTPPSGRSTSPPGNFATALPPFTEKQRLMSGSPLI